MSRPMVSPPPQRVAPMQQPPIQAVGPGPRETAWWLGALTLLALGWLSQTLIAFRPNPDLTWTQQLPRYAIELLIPLVGIAVGLALRRLSPAGWQKFAPSLLMVAMFVLVICKFQGQTVNGADRWVNLGFVRFQPLELAKLAIILSAAALFAPLPAPDCSPREARERQSERGGFFLMIYALILFLVLVQPNISGVILLLAILITLALAGGMPFRSLLLLGCVLGIAGGFFLLRDPERGGRIMAALYEHKEGATLSYEQQQERHQPKLARYAIAGGGIFGKGPGRSEVKYSLGEAASTDFVFAILVEEYGLIGGAAIIIVLGLGVLLLLLWSAQCESRFFQLVGLGIAAHLGYQILVHLSVNLGGVTTGVPLPFFSKGGSAAFILGIELALGGYIAALVDRSPSFVFRKLPAAVE